MYTEEEETTWGNTFKRLDSLFAFMTKKLLEAKRKIKPEVKSKTFSCTPWQTYSELFGMYDQQNVCFIIFIYLFPHQYKNCNRKQ